MKFTEHFADLGRVLSGELDNFRCIPHDVVLANRLELECRDTNGSFAVGHESRLTIASQTVNKHSKGIEPSCSDSRSVRYVVRSFWYSIPFATTTKNSLQSTNDVYN
jgi:hypothetical protein